jgi:hypothetical protein
MRSDALAVFIEFVVPPIGSQGCGVPNMFADFERHVQRTVPGALGSSGKPWNAETAEIAEKIRISPRALRTLR